jgi:hypothetical protein
LSNENILLAKEIFMKYGGSHFHMEREGEYQYYKSFCITKEQEGLWIKEYLQEMLNSIENEDIVSPSFSRLSISISEYNDIFYFKKLVELVKCKRVNTDTFSQMRMAEEILDIIEDFSKNHDILNKNTKLIRDAKHLALDILNDITKKPITVASYYRDIGYLHDVIQEDKIISRVQRLIEKWKK